jgi:hypothetical protein
MVESRARFVAADNEEQIVAVRRIETHDVQHISRACLRCRLGESLVQLSD